MTLYGPPFSPAQNTSSDVFPHPHPPPPPKKKGGKRAGNLKIRDLIQKVIVDPATRRGKEKLVYRLIVNSSPPRKSLVEGERFVRDEGDPELLRVV